MTRRGEENHRQGGIKSNSLIYTLKFFQNCIQLQCHGILRIQNKGFVISDLSNQNFWPWRQSEIRNNERFADITRYWLQSHFFLPVMLGHLHSTIDYSNTISIAWKFEARDPADILQMSFSPTSHSSIFVACYATLLATFWSVDRFIHLKYLLITRRFHIAVIANVSDCLPHHCPCPPARD